MKAKQNIIIFDLDGVLIDSIDLMFTLNQNRFPGSSREDFKLLFMGNIHEQIDNLKETYQLEGISEEDQNMLRREYTKQKTETVNLYPEIKELLDTLKKSGYPLSVNTSASDANTFNLLDRLGIKDYFDHIITKDFTQSKVDKFHEIARLYPCEISDMLFITDSIGDVLEAQELNIPTIAVTWGIHNKKDFEKQSFDNLLVIVDSVDSLKTTLFKHL